MAIEISRIEREFILKYMTESRGRVELIQGSNILKGSVSLASPTLLDISFSLTPQVFPEQGSSAEVFFLFKGTRIAGKTKVIRVDKRYIQVDLPKTMYRDLSRNYERVSPEEQIGVSLMLEGKILKLDFPVYQSGDSNLTPPELNVKFDSAKISELLKGFREKVKSFSNEHKIVMFRERQPELITERIVAWTGKILMLPVADAESSSQRKEDDRLDILFDQDIRSIIKSSGANSLIYAQELANHIDQMYQKKIWHELYVPILYRQYVIGYLYLLRSESQSSGFSSSVIEFVRQFARILAYSLASNNYFSGVYIQESFDKNDLVDISASGLLFSMPLQGPSLDLLADIDINIHLRDRIMPVRSRVMRRFQEASRVFIGIKYLEVQDADLEFLLEFLYGGNRRDTYTEEPILPEQS